MGENSSNLVILNGGQSNEKLVQCQFPNALSPNALSPNDVSPNDIYPNNIYPKHWLG
jgi:hypothetical protein